MISFFEKHGWSGAQPLAVDASARRYYRVFKGGNTAIFMDSSQSDSDEHKKFVRIANWLRSQGLSAPEVYEYEPEQGFMLLEDFGGISFKRALAAGENEENLYVLAVSALDVLKEQANNIPLDLPDYYGSNVHKGRRRIVDWFAPLVRQERNPDGLIEEYFEVWNEIEKALPEPQLGFVHIDFHVENLMWLPERDGVKRCGILDFQGAMKGPVLYDLANLLYDARREVSELVKQEILQSLTEEDRLWTLLLATQFHCRVIGQFVKFAVKNEDLRYLEHIPRLQNYIHEALKEPALKPLKSFFDDLKLDFSAVYALNRQDISRIIREDAF